MPDTTGLQKRLREEQAERDLTHKAIHEESLLAGKLHGLLGHCEASERIHHAAEVAVTDALSALEAQQAELTLLREVAKRAEERHHKSLHPATRGEHKGRYFCVGCTVSVDGFTAYRDWPCPEGAALQAYKEFQKGSE